MPGVLEFRRSRRSLLKVAGITLGALAGSAVPRREARAEWWCWWCGDDGGGGRYGRGGSCFLRGSRVRTPDGYRPIETLAAGAMVWTRFAGPVAIKHVSSFILSRPAPDAPWSADETMPVRIRRGALGENMPACDLCLTAAHALFVEDGVLGRALVPAGDLVNGTSIVAEQAAGERTLEFFHIETARHDVLDVEGALAETLRDPASEPCAKLLGFHGGREQLASRLRSAASVVIDRRRPIDVIRDRIEERGAMLMRPA